MLNPLLSIIIPSYNSESTITAAIESILSQSFRSFEIIILDSISTDKTVEKVKPYLSDDRIKFYSEKDHGVYDAMNKGIDLSSGEWLYFMGSDDILSSRNIIKEIVIYLEDDFDFVYGNVIFKNSKIIYSGESSLSRLMRDEISICHQSIFYRKTVFVKKGKYNLKYFIHSDYDFNVKCFKDHEVRKIYISEIIAVYNEKGLSSQHSNADNFHTHLREEYVRTYEDPVKLYLENKNLKNQLDRINNSKIYQFVKILISTLQRIKKYLGKPIIFLGLKSD